jgi:hypothetical protein
MAMRPCEKCLDNRWTYLLNETDYSVTATCKNCRHAAKFLTKKGKAKKDGFAPKPCRLGPTEWVEHPDYVPFPHGPGPGDDLNEVPW